jgi:hypothetical protein
VLTKTNKTQKNVDFESKPNLLFAVVLDVLCSFPAPTAQCETVLMYFWYIHLVRSVPLNDVFSNFSAQASVEKPFFARFVR